MSASEKISIVIPAYNEALTLENNISRLVAALEPYDFSCIIVDDGSHDATWEKITALSQSDARISGLRLSRNFGKEAALCAGLKEAKGEYILTMDSDMQHPPECIPEMIRLMEETGADIVDGVKQHRGKESRLYALCAKSFYRLLLWLTGINFNNSSDFKLMKEPTVDALKEFDERNVFFRGLVDWIGYKHVPYFFSVQERTSGKSTFTLFKKLQFSINAILAYSSKPLLLSFLFSIIFFFIAIILGFEALYTFFSGDSVSGATTIILLLLIIGSFLFFILSVIGCYVAKIYDEIKKRPQCIVSEKI